uniref:Putative transposase is4 n=1 Tax=Panstrongylus lignarius TaxID=156445 RepID=A0A224XRP2_9HEMI
MKVYAFIALLIVSGAMRSNRESEKMLCCNDYAFKLPILYSSTISRERFKCISSYLRFDGMYLREERRPTDKLAALREVTDMFTTILSTIL